MITINKIKEAFELLYSNMLDDKFSKQGLFHYNTEKHLLPIVRFFLLGYFGKSFEPEALTDHVHTYSGFGRFDFLIDKVAVELAVRTPDCPSSKLKKIDNEGEIIKLTKYNGPSVLVLLDFSKKPLTESDLETYRDIPSLGRGFHRRPFSLLYFFKDKYGVLQVIRKNIRKK